MMVEAKERVGEEDASSWVVSARLWGGGLVCACVGDRLFGGGGGLTLCCRCLRCR